MEAFFKISDEVGGTEIQVDARDKVGNAPLHLALLFGDKKAAELLLRRGADPNLVNEEGSTPLHFQRRLRHGEDVVRDRRRARTNGAGGRAGQAGQRTVALGRGTPQPKAGRIADEQRRRSEIVQCQGMTPVHFMYKKCTFDDSPRIFFKTDEEVVQRIHDEVRDKKGRTMLQWCVANYLPLAVRAILNEGADLSSFVFPTVEDFDEHVEAYKALKLKDQVYECRDDRSSSTRCRAAARLVFNLHSPFELYYSDENVCACTCSNESSGPKYRCQYRWPIRLHRMLRRTDEKINVFRILFKRKAQKIIWRYLDAITKYITGANSLNVKLVTNHFQARANHANESIALKKELDEKIVSDFECKDVKPKLSSPSTMICKTEYQHYSSFVKIENGNQTIDLDDVHPIFKPRRNVSPLQSKIYISCVYRAIDMRTTMEDGTKELLTRRDLSDLGNQSHGQHDQQDDLREELHVRRNNFLHTIKNTQRLKIVVECKDVKPNINWSVVKKIDEDSQIHLQNIKNSHDNKKQNISKIKIVSEAKQEIFDTERMNLNLGVKTHMGTVHIGARYVCDSCGKSFARKMNLKVHIDAIHNGIKHACVTCVHREKYTNYNKQRYPRVSCQSRLLMPHPGRRVALVFRELGVSSARKQRRGGWKNEKTSSTTFSI
ncbi:unnamed protein product [Trichogramma brassicae]|uniref:C2H2-type domain-containing protein n=1 Tax=Trichogramma brassicae TaxID=86971 RepID=A0A6H5IM27_9HYME|nr:unnamed protein product [Trichogramma brassicae]